MCLIAYDGSTGREPYWLCLNSWGPGAHGAVPATDDAPPGSFWLTRDSIECITGEGDAWAISDTDLFQPDLKVFK
jgi:hypothetical protein